jgi:SAM-dependent methyltransferase
MFSKTARYYDRVYGAKDHAGEAARLLDIVRENLRSEGRQLPDVPFHLGDLIDFDPGRTFDVVTCLFDLIGYVKTLENVYRAAACMANHLVPGGLLVVEPWFAPGNWRAPSVHAILVDERARDRPRQHELCRRVAVLL